MTEKNNNTPFEDTLTYRATIGRLDGENQEVSPPSPQIEELEEKLWNAQTWLAEADFGFGGWWSMISQIEKFAEQGDIPAIIKLTQSIRQSEQDLELTEAKTWKERFEKLRGDTRELKAALRWIPVEEKLPETTGQYLVWVCGIGDDGEMSRCAVEARFNAKFKVWTPHHGWLSQEVQGWLPMLKPPELG